MTTKKTYLILSVIFLASLILFYPSLNYYFFQDDWFVLNWVNSQNFLSFFQFRTDIIYWRPFSMPLFFALGKYLFDLNPLGFHLIAFTFHLSNTVLVYLLIRILRMSKTSSFLASFLYATSAFHFIPLSWLSTTSYVIGTTFILSSLIFYLKSKIKISFVLFLLAIMSTELAFTIIPLILIVEGFKKRILTSLIPFAVVLLIYLLARFIIFPVPVKGEYGLNLNLKVLINLFWYILWNFNFAEKFSTIFFLSNIKQSPLLFLQFLKVLIFPSFLIVGFLVGIFSLKLEIKKITFGISWFLIGLLPVIFLTNHAYPAYLAIASIGLIYIFLQIIEKISKRKPYFLTLIIVVWFASSYWTLRFTRENHWITNLQAISRAYAVLTKDQVKNPSPRSVFIFRPADIPFSNKNKFTLVETEDNLKQALNDQDAIRVIYQNRSLLSFFSTHQSKIQFPQSEQVYEISPRIDK